MTVFAGFPDDLPQHVIDQVNFLARREMRGHRVPTLIATYTGDDGHKKSLIWQPQEHLKAALKRYGLSDDRPGVA